MTRRVVIHGHLYQPPREDPWTGEVPVEPSAAPFANWNERITAECYQPNACATVLQGEGKLATVRNNYASISFNVGPTLAGWLERHAPEVHEALVAADRVSHTALAQPWVHAILPLCCELDRRTLVRWGILDFERRFGRQPEGMWLPETGVDTPTLETLAAQGIRFTILAPRQLARTTSASEADWGEEVDPRVPYRIGLPSGRSVDVLTYDGALSNAVAFEDVLRDGIGFAGRVLSAHGEDGAEEPIAAVVTDFETFGHHHRFGEMALAKALDVLEAQDGVAVVSAATAVRGAAPGEGRLVEPSSWSCAHGVERWRSDCGCRAGAPTANGQSWRAPLRDALDWLRAEASDAVSDTGLVDRWGARDEYGSVLTGAVPIGDWLEPRLEPGADGERARTWLELQRHLLFMFSSCGWFFDDAAGYETLLNLRHAARSLELLRALGGPDLEPGLVDALRPLRSEDPRYPEGAVIWDELVRRRSG